MDDGYEHLGNGPEATGNGTGWTMRNDLYARCTRCGNLISLDPTEYGDCTCGALHDGGRLYRRRGSRRYRDHQRRRHTRPQPASRHQETPEARTVPKV